MLQDAPLVRVQMRSPVLDPSLELRRVGKKETVEKRTDIQGGGSFGVVFVGQLELRDIARDDVRVQPDLGGSHHEVFGAEITAQGREDLTERVAATIRVALGP